MNDVLPIADGRCLASGQMVNPYVIEPLMTVLCPECGAEVPVRELLESESADYQITPHEQVTRGEKRRLRGTQLMLDF